MLPAILGLSLNSERTTVETFNLSAKNVQTIYTSNQACLCILQVDAYLRSGGKERARGTMFFVIGIKLATDASVTGKVRMNVMAGMGVQGLAGKSYTLDALKQRTLKTPPRRISRGKENSQWNIAASSLRKRKSTI